MDVELKHGFKYHHDGDEVDAKFITISAYNMKKMSLVAPIKEIVIKALARYGESIEVTAEERAEIEKASKVEKTSKDKKVEKASKVEKTSKDKKVEKASIESAKLMITIITVHSNEGDLGKLWVYMRSLLTSGVAYIDGGDTKFSGTYIDDLNPADFENLCGEYIGNFIT